MGKARNLARLVVDSGGAVDASNLTNAVPADGSITSAKIADGAVATADIADSAITTAKIAAGAVATVDIADSAVTTAKIADANVTMAKLSATGTPGSGNYLRGDGSWQAVSTTPTTDQVLTATAGASFGAVGTYAVLMNVSATTVNAGGTIAGSNLRYNSEAASRTPFQGYSQAGSTWGGGGTAPSGTWRAMAKSNGRFDNGCNSYSFLPSFFLRIS